MDQGQRDRELETVMKMTEVFNTFVMRAIPLMMSETKMSREDAAAIIAATAQVMARLNGADHRRIRHYFRLLNSVAVEPIPPKGIN
jgi:hypothetical protein